MGEGDLRRYEEKRDFRRTPEPRAADRPAGDRPRFVVQKHDARRLHYDLRLEIDGVLKSWAVPKGPSTDPRDKRLAVPTEDHPLDYLEFEGSIPRDQYGGGTVLVWDLNTYRNLSRDEEGGELPMGDALERGHLKVWLEGRKLTGGYALTRTPGLEGDEDAWLLVKMDDEEADARRNPTSTQPDSVLSGRSLEEIAEES